MFFIVGTGRSGTNLLRSILNLHPEVWVATETHFIRTLLQKFGDRKFDVSNFSRIALNHWTTGGTERWVHKHLEAGGHSPQSFHESFAEFSPVQRGTVREFVDAFFRYCYGSGYSQIGDKTPFYGRHMKAIRQQWPEPKFVHMVRDGRHAAASMQKHMGFVRMINAGFPDKVEHYSFNKEAASYSTEPVTKLDCIRFWGRIATDIRRESERIPQESYLEMRFEDLVLHPLRETVRIVRFLDLPVSFSHLGRAVQVPQPFKLGEQFLAYEPASYDRLTEEIEDELRTFEYSTQPYRQNRLTQLTKYPKEMFNRIVYQRVGRGLRSVISCIK
jgi:hypothetical protein